MDHWRFGDAHQALHLVELGRRQQRIIALHRPGGAHLLQIRLRHQCAQDQFVVVIGPVAPAQFLDRRLLGRIGDHLLQRAAPT